MTFEFRNFTASAVETNSPLLGYVGSCCLERLVLWIVVMSLLNRMVVLRWIRLDADLNEILATSQVRDFLLLDL